MDMNKFGTRIPFDPTEKDVISTKIRSWNMHHPGNLLYQDMLVEYALQLPSFDDPSYVALQNEFADEVVRKVLEEQGGRFIKIQEGDDPLNPRWCWEMNYKASHHKVFHGLKNKQKALLMKSNPKQVTKFYKFRGEGGSGFKINTVSSSTTTTGGAPPPLQQRQQLLLQEQLVQKQKKTTVQNTTTTTKRPQQRKPKPKQQQSTPLPIVRQKRKRKPSLKASPQLFDLDYDDEGDDDEHYSQRSPLPKKQRIRRGSTSPTTSSSKTTTTNKNAKATTTTTTNNKKSTASTKKGTRKNTITKYEAKEGPGGYIHPYALELITQICNNCYAHSNDISFLNQPGPTYSRGKNSSLQQQEPEKERLIRLQLRHRFYSALAVHMPVLEFAKRLMTVWGGVLVERQVAAPKAALNTKTKTTKAKPVAKRQPSKPKQQTAQAPNSKGRAPNKPKTTTTVKGKAATKQQASANNSSNTSNGGTPLAATGRRIPQKEPRKVALSSDTNSSNSNNNHNNENDDMANAALLLGVGDGAWFGGASAVASANARGVFGTTTTSDPFGNVGEAGKQDASSSSEASSSGDDSENDDDNESSSSGSIQHSSSSEGDDSSNESSDDENNENDNSMHEDESDGENAVANSDRGDESGFLI